MSALLASLLAAAALAAPQPAPLTLEEVAMRVKAEGKPWSHTQPQAGELGYDYARQGRRLAYKPATDGLERECIVTFDADREPFDLIFVSSHIKKEKGVRYLVDAMTLRVSLDGKLLAAVRASGKGTEIIRAKADPDNFYTRQVFDRELYFHQNGAVKPPEAPPE